MITLTLTGNTPSKKNAKQIVRNQATGKVFLVSNKNYYKWEKENLPVLKSYRIPTMEYPVDVHIEIIRQTKRRWDWNNISQAITDILVKAKIIIDDDAEHCRPVFTTWSHNKDNPCAIVTIKKMEEIC